MSGDEANLRLRRGASQSTPCPACRALCRFFRGFCEVFDVTADALSSCYVWRAVLAFEQSLIITNRRGSGRQPALTPWACAVFFRLYKRRSADCNSSGAVRPSSG